MQFNSAFPMAKDTLVMPVVRMPISPCPEWKAR